MIEMNGINETASLSPRPAIELLHGRLVVCANCGCRLQLVRASEPESAPGFAWRHFEGETADRDAVGCRFACVGADHS